MQRTWIAAAVLWGAALGAQATPVTYDFSANVTGGNAAGSTVSGYFTYDSATAAPSQFVDGPGLFTDFSFNWGGVAYTAATVGTGYLGFDAAGVLNDFVFGNDCSAGGCSVTAGSNDWYLASYSFNFAEGQDIVFSDAPSFTLRNVPEPGSLALFGVALAGLTLVRKKKMQG